MWSNRQMQSGFLSTWILNFSFFSRFTLACQIDLWYPSCLNSSCSTTFCYPMDLTRPSSRLSQCLPGFRPDWARAAGSEFLEKRRSKPRTSRRRRWDWSSSSGRASCRKWTLRSIWSSRWLTRATRWPARLTASWESSPVALNGKVSFRSATIVLLTKAAQPVSFSLKNCPNPEKGLRQPWT